MNKQPGCYACVTKYNKRHAKVKKRVLESCKKPLYPILKDDNLSTKEQRELFKYLQLPLEYLAYPPVFVSNIIHTRIMAFNKLLEKKIHPKNPDPPAHLFWYGVRFWPNSKIKLFERIGIDKKVMDVTKKYALGKWPWRCGWLDAALRGEDKKKKEKKKHPREDLIRIFKAILGYLNEHKWKYRYAVEYCEGQDEIEILVQVKQKEMAEALNTYPKKITRMMNRMVELGIIKLIKLDKRNGSIYSLGIYGKKTPGYYAPLKYYLNQERFGKELPTITRLYG